MEQFIEPLDKIFLKIKINKQLFAYVCVSV